MTKKNDFLNASPAINIEAEEHLSANRLAALKVSDKYKLNIDHKNRPVANFMDLMNWSKVNFSPALTCQDNLNCFIHNKIIIDGQFLQYCDMNKVSVDVLQKDSIVSWKTDSDSEYEKFFIQGAFLIKTKSFEFLNFALMHKGSQQEDEISFFVVVSDANYEAYIKFRNEFDLWISQRDRSNHHIRVVEGEDIPYTRDNSWDDLFLPQNLKSDIKSLVENFLASKDFYKDHNLPWKRGLLLYGVPGNGKSSVIKTIISNYNFKPVTINASANDDVLREAFAYAEDQSPSLLFFEDLDSLLEKNIDISTFLNLIDGINAVNGLFIIATANNIHKLKSNITERPSRFDRKIEIPLPDQKMSEIYLKKWFKNLISSSKYKELAKLTVKYKFSYAYIKELFLSSMFEALSNNRKAPSEADINTALDKLLKEKNILNVRSVKTDKYFI